MGHKTKSNQGLLQYRVPTVTQDNDPGFGFWGQVTNLVYSGACFHA